MNNKVTPALEANQPKNLYGISFIELWERFGFYIVQALLVLFLTKSRHLSDSQSYDIYSAFSALIYATPIVGGYLADRFLGFRRAIILGGILFTLGYFGLATTNNFLFFPSLALLLCGNGFFKSCISTLVGTLYEENDPRRDGGYTIFYMGINIGAFLGPLIGAPIADAYGWGYGFATGGIGMLIGLAFIGPVFKKLGNHGLPPDAKYLHAKVFLGLSREHLIWLGTLFAIVFFSILFYYARIVNHAFNFFALFIGIAILIMTLRYEREQRNKMLAFLILTVFAILFWAIYVQSWTSLTLFTEKITDRHFFNWIIPTAMFQSVNPFFIVALTPVLTFLWVKTSGTRFELSTPGKFALAMFAMSAGYLIFPLALHFAPSDGLISMSWLNLSYFLQTFGELCLSPIGLSMVIGLTPVNIRGMMMGIWFLSNAIAYSLGDSLANMAVIPTGITDPVAMGKIYGHAFTIFGVMAFLVGIILMAFIPFLKRMTKEMKS